MELKKGSFELKKQGSFRNSCGLIAHLKESWGKMESVVTCASLAFAQIQTCDGMIASPSSLRFVREFFTVTVAMNQEGLAYSVVGGLALAFHSQPRFTRDIEKLKLHATSERIEPESIDPAYPKRSRSTCRLCLIFTFQPDPNFSS